MRLNRYVRVTVLLSARVHLGRGGVGVAEDYCMRMRAVPRSVYCSDVYGRHKVRVSVQQGTDPTSQPI